MLAVKVLLLLVQALPHHLALRQLDETRKAKGNTLLISKQLTASLGRSDFKVPMEGKPIG